MEWNVTTSLLCIGSQDFSARVSSVIRTDVPGCVCHSATLGGAWSAYLSGRAEIVLIEIGLRHHASIQQGVRLLLKQIRERFETAPIIVLALSAPERLGFGGDLLFEEAPSFGPSQFVDAMLAPAPGSLALPALKEQLVDLISHASEELKRRATGKTPLPPLGASGWVQSLADPKSRSLWMRWLPRYASYTNENPVIIGDTGSGKTNLAYALHLLSGRKGKFVSITPRDFSSSELVQAELFGAVPGAYTGAVEKWGLVRMAEGGTLFIDELQSIDKELQGKLITFIENKIYRRVGASETVHADVRFVFASNKSLEFMREQGVLREDFAYRLERVILSLAPLRERPLDVASGLAFALAKIRRQRPESIVIEGFTPAAYRALLYHPWPGNLRQLENTVARLCDYADLRKITLIDEVAVMEIVSDLNPFGAAPHEVVVRAAQELSRRAITEKIAESAPAIHVFQDILRKKALETTGGDVTQAAQILGEHPTLLSLFAEEHVKSGEVWPK